MRMKLITGIMGISACLALPVSFANAEAGLPDCGCAPAGSLGTVVSATGQVIAESDQGFGPVRVGAELPASATVMTGPKSSARIAFGFSCENEIGENSRLSMQTSKDGKLCPAIVKSGAVEPATRQFGQANTERRSGAFWATLGVGIGTAGAVSLLSK